MSFLYLLKEVKMKAKNKPCSFTLPLQIPQLKGKKTRISLTTENTIISSLQKQQNPKKHPTKQNQTKNPEKTSFQQSWEMLCCFLPRTEDRLHWEICVWAAQYGHAELYAYIPQTDRATELRSWATNCTSMAILIRIIQWQKAFSSKAPLQKMLFQNLWHVHHVCPAFPQPEPPTSPFMETESWMCTSQPQETTCARQHRNKLNGIRAQPHRGCAELSQEKPEGKWRFLANKPRRLAVSSCRLRLLPGRGLRQHVMLDSLTTCRQTKINYTRARLAATETNCWVLWEPEPLFCQRSPFCPLQTGPARPSGDAGAQTAGRMAQPRLPHCWGAPRAPLLGPPAASVIHAWISALNWWN